MVCVLKLLDEGGGMYAYERVIDFVSSALYFVRKFVV